MGYGWIDFVDVVASTAAQQLNGAKVKGHDILISFSQPKRAMDEDPPCQHKEWSDWKRLRQKNGLQHFVCIQCGAKWKRATQARKETEKQRVDLPKHGASLQPQMTPPHSPQGLTLLQQRIQAAINSSTASMDAAQGMQHQYALNPSQRAPQHQGLYQLPPQQAAASPAPTDRFAQMLSSPQPRLPPQHQQSSTPGFNPQPQPMHLQQFPQFQQQSPYRQPPLQPQLQAHHQHPLALQQQQQQLQLQQMAPQMVSSGILPQMVPPGMGQAPLPQMIPQALAMGLPQAGQQGVHLQYPLQKFGQPQLQPGQYYPPQPNQKNAPPKQLSAANASINFLKRMDSKDGTSSPMRSAFHLSAAHDAPVQPTAQPSPTCAPTRPGATAPDTAMLHQADFFFNQQGSLLLPSNLTTFDMASLNSGSMPPRSMSGVSDVSLQSGSSTLSDPLRFTQMPHISPHSPATPSTTGTPPGQSPGALLFHRPPNQYAKPKLEHINAAPAVSDSLIDTAGSKALAPGTSPLRETSPQSEVDWIRVQFEELLHKITEGFAESQIDPASHVIHKLAAQKEHFEWFNKLTEDANAMLRSLTNLYMTLLPADSLLYSDMQALKQEVKSDKWFT